MRRVFLGLMTLVLAAILGHFAVLNLVPRVIMNKAMTAMEARGIAVHDFTLSPRLTPQTQTVVRPSPDLAYSICLFDFSKGGVLHVAAGPYDKYASISFFDAETNNFRTLRVGKGEAGAGKTAYLYPPKTLRSDMMIYEDMAFGVSAPTPQGIILIRRLAPAQADYEEVAKIAAQDRCELKPPNI